MGDWGYIPKKWSYFTLLITVFWTLYRYNLGLSPLPVTVTTRIITFLVGDPYKPSFDFYFWDVVWNGWPWKSSWPNNSWLVFGMIDGARIPDPTNGQAVWSTWTSWTHITIIISYNSLSLRMCRCVLKKDTIPTILLCGWDWNHQYYWIGRGLESWGIYSIQNYCQPVTGQYFTFMGNNINTSNETMGLQYTVCVCVCVCFFLRQVAVVFLVSILPLGGNWSRSMRVSNEPKTLRHVHPSQPPNRQNMLFFVVWGG